MGLWPYIRTLGLLMTPYSPVCVYVMCAWHHLALRLYLAMEDLHEGLAELNVEGGVNNWVDGAVDIPEPREGTVHRRWDVAVAMHVQDVGDEKGEPAYDENTWEIRKEFGLIALSCHFNPGRFVQVLNTL